MMEKQRLVERPKILSKFTELNYSFNSQEKIAALFPKVDGSDNKEALAKHILKLMDSMSEEEVVRVLTSEEK